jgi:hypothetical protein
LAASASDKFKYLSRKWVGQVGAGGVANNSVTTIPLSSTTNLPTATGISIVIDRVDVNGVATPSLEETCTGVVSGANIISAIRGVEGTAQAHSAGAVVEVLVTAADWQSVMDGILVEHGQDGTHAATIIKTTGTQTLATKTLTTPVIASFYQDAGLTKLMTTPNTASDTLTANAATQTLTNKRITKRILSAASYTTDTGTSLNCDNLDWFIVTAQAGALLFNNPTGTPTDGQLLAIAVSSSTTVARALTYGNQFESSTATLPTTTAATTARLNILVVWRADTSKWACLAAV